MSERFQSIEAFWPYYLSEHQDAVSRRLHFVGTTGWLAAVAGSLALNPLGFGAALTGMVALGAHGLRKERTKRPLAHVAGMIALPTLASPVLFPAGVVWAYGMAWAGHFGFEKNRPATFQYPIMSLTSDLKMWGHMVRGRLWSGDPLDELGLEAPDTPATQAAAK